MCPVAEAKAYQQSDSTCEPSRSVGTRADGMSPSGRHNSYLRWSRPLAFGVGNDVAGACRVTVTRTGFDAMYDIQLFGRLEVRTRGVQQFTLLLSPEAIDFSRPVRVTVNGRTVAAADLQDGDEVRVQVVGQYRADGAQVGSIHPCLAGQPL